MLCRDYQLRIAALYVLMFRGGDYMGALAGPSWDFDISETGETIHQIL